MDWIAALRERLGATIAGLDNLTPEQKASLLADELKAAVKATEAGLPFGATPEAETPAEETEEAENQDGQAGDTRPVAARRPFAKPGPGRAW